MKIGITESNDASICYDWIEKLNEIDGAIIITKNITEMFKEKIIENKEKIIVHVTCTGFGGTIVEPKIPNYKIQISNAFDMVKKGFPINKLVIRIDPIIPIGHCLNYVDFILNEVKILFETIDIDWNQKIRFRISIMDLYPHVKERFKEKGLKIPYNSNFQPSDSEFKLIDEYLLFLENKYKIKFESCAEPKLKNINKIGCVSIKDMELLNLDTSSIQEQLKNSRRGCLCSIEKTELLPYRQKCAYGCLYCYWKHNE